MNYFQIFKITQPPAQPHCNCSLQRSRYYGLGTKSKTFSEHERNLLRRSVSRAQPLYSRGPREGNQRFEFPDKNLLNDSEYRSIVASFVLLMGFTPIRNAFQAHYSESQLSHYRSSISCQQPEFIESRVRCNRGTSELTLGYQIFALEVSKGLAEQL